MKALLTLLFLILTSTLFSQTYVRGYTKKNGTYVAPHYRSSPNSTKSDNYSTKGNYNPYTGKPGTKKDDGYNSSPSYSTPSYSNSNSSASYEDWDSYTIQEYYEKIELPTGSLDNNGNQIDYIYKVMPPPKVGKYSVSISDKDGDIFEIKGTGIYVKFRGYHGYAGYSEEGVLDIQSSYSSTYYKQP